MSEICKNQCGAEGMTLAVKTKHEELCGFMPKPNELGDITFVDPCSGQGHTELPNQTPNPDNPFQTTCTCGNTGRMRRLRNGLRLNAKLVRYKELHNGKDAKQIYIGIYDEGKPVIGFFKHEDGGLLCNIVAMVDSVQDGVVSVWPHVDDFKDVG